MEKFGVIKYVPSKGEGGGQLHLGSTSIAFIASFYCLKVYKGKGVSETTKFDCTYFMDDPYPVNLFNPFH